MRMKKANAFVVALAVGLICSCNNPSQETAKPVGNGLPQDVKASCIVDSAQFSSWFAGGKAVTNGFVKHANSVAFNPEKNCNFYRWAEQMFLWLTSQDSVYGNDHSKRVMESPLFYTVGPDTSNNFSQNRILIPHSQGTTLRASCRIRQVGPNRLPVIADSKGRRFEVESAANNEKPMVKDVAGKLMAVSRIETGANGVHTLIGEDGKVISKPQAYIKHARGKQVVQEVRDGNGRRVYLDRDGNEVEAETGQATNNVLVAQNGSIVYYLLFVNDVYAYYQGGVSSPNKIVLNPNQFPTTAGGRDSICALARANGHVLPDSNALAIELKTSWVEAKNLPDAESNYITIQAVVPTYKLLPGGKAWVMNGEKTVKLAMIGMHVVGSVAHHPEMIWATFEHRRNAPNAVYQYIDSNGKVKTVPNDTGKHWLLSSNASDTAGSFVNQSNQTWSFNNGGDTIYSDTSRFIPSNVLRTMPWGSALDSATNQEDKSSAASNSEIIAINNAVYNLLPGNDVRKNYFFVGATWTFGGTAPSGAVYSASDVSLTGVGIGTNVIANSTMETFFQSPSGSCFTTCHSGISASLSPDSLSHIFQYIVPLRLPKVPASMNK